MKKTLFALLAIASLAQPASAEVASVSPQGFSVVHKGTIPIAPEEAYIRFTGIWVWWNPEHSFSGDAGNFRFDPSPGGCWCEALGERGAVKHMEIVFASPGQMVVLRGGLGPLLFMGAQASWTVSFEAAEGGGTNVTWVLNVGGYDPGNFTELSTAVDGVLGEQFTRYITPPQ